ncbi:MAG: hypothetical protein JRF72_02555 [Deltaproteobacteria bacterium]|jgi:hypothetical protein|nr:hypothetical protein [Deltaproteobacteria bacterium]
MSHGHRTTAASSSGIRYFYLVTVFFLTLTGFGQMPIFKRYYIADLPGLGWLAEFFVTHYIHYLGAILFLALAFYILLDFVVLKRRSRKLTKSGWIRCTLLGVILVSGVFLIIRNLSGSNLSATFIILLDLSHLGSVMAFLLLGLYCLIFRKKWTTLN